MIKNGLIILFILIINSTFAQEFSYGVGAGPTVSTIAEVPFKDATATQGELGSFFYAFGEYTLNDKLNLHAKLGLDNRVVNNGSEMDAFYKINYLSFMPSVKFDTGGSKSDSGIFLKPGLRLSSFLSADDTTNNIDISEEFQSLIFGFNIGLGVDFAKHYSFELLLDFGISNEVKESDSKNRLNSVMFLFEINLESILKKDSD